MFQRLGISGRLALIALLLLFAALAIGTWAGIASRAGRTGAPARLPLPDQIAALVELLEKEPQNEKRTVLRAANSDVLKVSLSPSLPRAPEAGRRMPAVEWLIDQYFDRPGGRQIYAWDEVFERNFWRSSAFLSPLRRTVLLAVELKSGGFAVFETQSEIVVFFGLPLGFWAGIAGALIGAFAIRAIIREGRPLKQLATAVERFASDAKPVPVVLKGGARETRALIAAVNAMQTRIAELLANRALLLGAISHDLKTYMTRLRLRVESIPDAVQYEKSVRDLDDMTQLLENALAIARGHGHGGKKDRVDVAALVDCEVAERGSLQWKAAAQHAAAPFIVEGDEVGLRRVVMNLLENAERFGGGGEVSLTCSSGTVTLIVDDGGPGIPMAYRNLVFDPFYRLEASRNRETGGSGLGLAIARQIVKAHGGTITIADSPLGGARFAVALPKIAGTPAVTLCNEIPASLQSRGKAIPSS